MNEERESPVVAETVARYHVSIRAFDRVRETKVYAVSEEEARERALAEIHFSISATREDA